MQVTLNRLSSRRRLLLISILQLFPGISAAEVRHGWQAMSRGVGPAFDLKSSGEGLRAHDPNKNFRKDAIDKLLMFAKKTAAR